MPIFAGWYFFWGLPKSFPNTPLGCSSSLSPAGPFAELGSLPIATSSSFYVLKGFTKFLDSRVTKTNWFGNSSTDDLVNTYATFCATCVCRIDYKMHAEPAAAAKDSVHSCFVRTAVDTTDLAVTPPSLDSSNKTILTNYLYSVPYISTITGFTSIRPCSH